MHDMSATVCRPVTRLRWQGLSRVVFGSDEVLVLVGDVGGAARGGCQVGRVPGKERTREIPKGGARRSARPCLPVKPLLMICDVRARSA